MSDMVRDLDNVIISLEPGGHEYAVPPRVAAYINQLQRENADIKKSARAYITEAHDNCLAQDAVCDHSVGICWCGYRYALEDLSDRVAVARDIAESPK